MLNYFPLSNNTVGNMVCKTGLLECNAAIFILRPAIVGLPWEPCNNNITNNQPKKHFGHNSVLFYTEYYAMIISQRGAMTTTGLFLTEVCMIQEQKFQLII